MTTAGEPLTPVEQSLWLLQQLVPDRGVTNVAVRGELSEQPRVQPLRETFRWLVRRHPALRSKVVMRDRQPVRVVDPPASLEPEVDLVDVAPDALEEALRAYAGRPFDPAYPPLVRLALFRTGPEQHCLCLVAHHLVVDAASLDLLRADIIAGYESLARTGVPPELPAAAAVPPAWPREGSLGYWRQRLAGFDPAGNRLDRARTPGASGSGLVDFSGDKVSRSFPSDLIQAVNELRARSRTTVAGVLLSGYLLALRAEGAADDLVVGAMVSTRGASQATDVGYRVSTVPLRVQVAPERTFAELAAEAGMQLLAAVEHADVSFEALVPEFAAGNEDPQWWRHGLVRHAFNFRLPTEGDLAGQAWPGVDSGLARFDLELTVNVGPDECTVELLYSTEVHDRDLAEALLDRLMAAIRQAHSVAARPVGDLDLRTPAEVALADSVNDTATSWAGPPTVPAAVAEIAAADPDAVAVVDGGRRLTYRQLVGAASQVARLLRAQRVGPGDLVALARPRSAELAAAVLGVWWVGAAYLPLDADHPPGRLQHELDDSGCRVILDGHLLDESVRAGRTCLPVPWSGRGETPAGADPAPVAADDLAYVIYTSGSTGPPKGVRLTHGNLANVVRSFARLLAAGRSTAMLWLTTFAFDISALELCLPLVAGGRVVVATDRVRAVPERLLDLVETAGVDVVQATPTTWRLVVPAAGDRLAGCDLLCGGEPLAPALARQLWAAGRRAFNVYGPTETTIWSTVAELTDEQVERVTAGRPIANTRVHILDQRGRPVPPGVTGELCLAGDGLAQGYHEQKELTAQRFRVDWVLGRYYRTGDLARLLPDRQLELLGRGDRQVKLRAHRIELAEVENVLAEHGEVAAAAVVLRGDPAADGYLAAFLAAVERPGLAEDVWAFARSRLPAYSIPGRMVVVAELPQTPNGKVDVKAIESWELPSDAPASATGGPAPEPGDGIEGRLIHAWRESLGRPALGRSANFFLHGGTSLMAVALAEVASARCGAPVTMGMIFRAPTPADLAALLREGGR